MDEARLHGRERAGSPGGFRAQARGLPCTQDSREATRRVRLGCRFYSCNFYNCNRSATTIPPVPLWRRAVGHQPGVWKGGRGCRLHGRGTWVLLLCSSAESPSPALSAGMLLAARRSRRGALAAGKPVGQASCPSHVPLSQVHACPWGDLVAFPGWWLRWSDGWSHLGKAGVTHLSSLESPCPAGLLMRTLPINLSTVSRDGGAWRAQAAAALQVGLGAGSREGGGHPPPPHHPVVQSP